MTLCIVVWQKITWSCEQPVNSITFCIFCSSSALELLSSTRVAILSCSAEGSIVCKLIILFTLISLKRQKLGSCLFESKMTNRKIEIWVRFSCKNWAVPTPLWLILSAWLIPIVPRFFLPWVKKMLIYWVIVKSSLFIALSWPTFELSHITFLHSQISSSSVFRIYYRVYSIYCCKNIKIYLFKILN